MRVPIMIRIQSINRYVAQLLFVVAASLLSLSVAKASHAASFSGGSLVGADPVAKSVSVEGSIGCVSALSLLAIAGIVISRQGTRLTLRQWAIQELNELEKSIDSNPSSSEAIAMELSKIVQDYLMLQFSTLESGRSSQELVCDIESSMRFEANITNQLRELFRLADTAQFAGLQISIEGFKSAINDSRRLIDRIANDVDKSVATTKGLEKR
jgi:hypothetical protein